MDPNKVSKFIHNIKYLIFPQKIGLYKHKIHMYIAAELVSVGSRNDKNSISRKRTYAETVANYVTPRVAPQIAVATHV